MPDSAPYPSTTSDFKALNDFADRYQSADPGDARGAGSKAWPAIGDLKVIDGHTMRWDGRNWSRADAAV